MKKYLATLQTRSPQHKKRFAFLVSGAFTLSIFGIWSLVTFGPEVGGILADRETSPSKVSLMEKKSEDEISPFESLRMNIAATFEAFRGGVGNFTNEIKTVDLGSEYNDLKSGALETYGQ